MKALLTTLLIVGGLAALMFLQRDTTRQPATAAPLSRTPTQRANPAATLSAAQLGATAAINDATLSADFARAGATARREATQEALQATQDAATLSLAVSLAQSATIGLELTRAAIPLELTRQADDATQAAIDDADRRAQMATATQSAVVIAQWRDGGLGAVVVIAPLVILAAVWRWLVGRGAEREANAQAAIIRAHADAQRTLAAAELDHVRAKRLAESENAYSAPAATMAGQGSVNVYPAKDARALDLLRVCAEIDGESATVITSAGRLPKAYAGQTWQNVVNDLARAGVVEKINGKWAVTMGRTIGQIVELLDSQSLTLCPNAPE